MIIDNAGTYTLRYTATDDCGKTTTMDRELKVKDSPSLFGVEWDGSDATTWTRTDESADFASPSPAVNNGTGSSPFDDLMPWSGMQIVEDADAGTLVSIPKFWYKWTRNGSSMKLQISNKRIDGFLISPAHADRGDGVGERDVVYVGRYHCLANYKSIKQGTTKPVVDITISDARNGIHSLGSDVWQYDFSMYWTIRMLYLVEFADWDSQKCIGYGCSENSQIISENGLTDPMTYHTGTNMPSRTDYGQIQYRHIEGLWSNAYDFVDGLYLNGSNAFAINNPSDFSNNSNGVIIGTRPNIYDDSIKSYSSPTVNGYEYALFPETTQGYDYTVRTCDCASVRGTDNKTVFSGGSYTSQSQANGLFCMYAQAPGLTNYGVGCRLMKLPSA